MLPVQIDHPSICTSDTVLSTDGAFELPPVSEKEPTADAAKVGDGDKEDNFLTATTTNEEPQPGVEILIESDFIETNGDGDLATVALEDKGKGVDPRGHGSSLCDPKLMVIPADTSSIVGSDSIELVGLNRDQGKNVDPEERGNGMAKDEPGPSRIDLHDDQEIFLQAVLLESLKPTQPTDSGVHLDEGNNVDPGNGMANEAGPSRIDFHDYGAASSQKQGIPLESFEQTKRPDLNNGVPYDPTLPRPSWYPKISPYRLIVFSTPLAIGTAKSVLSHKGSVTTPITLEWISGVVVLLV